MMFEPWCPALEPFAAKNATVVLFGPCGGDLQVHEAPSRTQVHQGRGLPLWK
jgi:hypothetical protein